MEWISYLQWPAMLVTVVGAWYTGSQHKFKRMVGFIAFLLSNVLWVVWGIHDSAWALIVLQGFLVVINIRNTRKNKTSDPLKD